MFLVVVLLATMDHLRPVSPIAMCQLQGSATAVISLHQIGAVSGLIMTMHQGLAVVAIMGR